MKSFGTLMEMFAGRLKTLYETNPAKAEFIIDNLLEHMLIQGVPDHMRKTYNIGIKADFDDPTRHKALLKALRKQARMLLTQANLLSDTGRPIQVSVETDDFFEGGTQEGLHDIDESEGDGIVPDEE